MNLVINPILCSKGNMNNYAYIIQDEEKSFCAIVDAAEAAPIIEFCKNNNLTPQYILTTHHHFDHVGGNLQLKEKYGLKIIGSDIEKNLIKEIDHTVNDGDTFQLGNKKVKAILAPGHTKGHILWHFEEDKILFTGDVLFNLCIGGLFEGTPQQMFESLQKIKSLDEETIFYPGHEYTKHCLSHALNQGGADVEKYANIVINRLKQNQPAAPINLGLEKKCNPYLKIDNLRIFSQLF